MGHQSAAVNRKTCGERPAFRGVSVQTAPTHQLQTNLHSNIILMLFEASIEEIITENKTGVDDIMDQVFGEYALYEVFNREDMELED